MSQYPTLASMGVTSLEDVVKYTLRHQGDADVLKIYYKRAKGSFLPRSKKFSFVRGRRSIPIESRGSTGFESISDISPQLTLALKELDQIEAKLNQVDPGDPKQQLEAHMAHLDKVVNEKLKEMQALIKQL
ncbi:hypothetical protein A9R01_12500 ['Osedax' symbiont bacterium Rs2_46_30_T18]|nr:hypothetical protein A9R01_12500 ['Osedax' symbiont bacterium Rs2_46_30_T18]